MATIAEVRACKVRYSSPNSRFENVKHKLPSSATGIPWECEGDVLLRIYCYRSGGRESLQMKVKLPGDLPGSQGLLGVRAVHPGYRASGITKVVLHPINGAGRTEVDLYFSDDNRRPHLDELQFEFSSNETATVFVTNTLCCRNSSAGNAMLADKAILVNGPLVQSGEPYSSFCLASKLWQALAPQPPAQADALSGARICHNRTPPSLLSLGSSLGGAAEENTRAPNAGGASSSSAGAERPCKLRKMVPQGYNSYTLLEKEQLVHLLLTRDEEIASLQACLQARGTDLGDVERRRRLEQICATNAD